jgi:uncharacterized membrane protein
MNEDFLTKFFINPVIRSEGYNPINTTVYAAIFVIAAYLTFKLLKKMNVKIDRRLAIAITPFVVTGSVLRVLSDAGVLTSFIFVTPSIYFLIFAMAIVTLSISMYLQKKMSLSYHKIMFIVGLTVVSILVNFLQLKNFYGAALDIGFFILWPIIFYFIRWDASSKIVASIQMFDATTTFTSLQFFNYSEQHVVPNIFISLFGPFSFIVVKAVAVIAILLLIDRFSEEKEYSNYLKLIIGILGAATSLRDFTRLVAMV